MYPAEIQDWQFGRLRWEDRWGWCTKEFEWQPGLTIGLCVCTELDESNTIPEHTRIFFNALRDHEKELRIVALSEAVNIDGFNEMLAEEGQPEGWPFSIDTFADYIDLWWAQIDPDDESELQYTTSGGPLLRVIISPDLSVKEAFLD